MVEQLILGAVQGIAEWLPVSSEGTIILVSSLIFQNQDSIDTLIKHVLFLHLGTFFAALFYFRSDVKELIILSIENLKMRIIKKQVPTNQDTQKILVFLTISTLISGLIGILLLALIKQAFDTIDIVSTNITVLVGLLLLITGYFQIKAKRGGARRVQHLTVTDGILLGIVQGFATLPGLSRSGLTVSTLLLRDMEKETALRLSFLMSLPIVLGGNILLNLDSFSFQPEALIGLAASFLFGIFTIHTFLIIAHRVNFGYFVFLLGSLMLFSVAL